MNTDLTRQYNLPKPVSNTTASIIEQYKQNLNNSTLHNDNNTTTGNNNNHPLGIPDLQDLLNMKADLEALLPLSESRVRDLKKDLSHLDRNVKIRDNEISGKNMNVIMEKMKIKQESDTSGDLHSSNIPKSESSRQAALEIIRRRRRREETENSDDVTRRSESPHHIIKLKKLDGFPSLASQNTTSSSSPPPSKQSNDTKKKKSNTHARAQHHHGGESSKQGKQHSKQKNFQQSKDDVDFVRVKPKDQVPIATFWTAMEPYFRNLTEEDRAFLLEKSDNSKPFLIPPLGQYYAEQWAEEDQAIGFGLHTRTPSRQSIDHTPQHKLKYLQREITDENLLQDDIGSGTLTERLLSSLVAEEILDPSEVKSFQNDDNDDPMSDVETDKQSKHHGRTIVELSSDPTEEIVSFEERLRRELRYAGLFADDDIDWNAKEDDEICAELRTLGREFKEQVKENDFRKKKLLQVVDTQLQFEQYRQVLDTLDSQVEQGYMKRFRLQKSKKRKTTGPKTMLSENAVFAMDKRKTWINALGGIFKDKNMIMPTTSIYTQDENSSS
ncbi:histone acetyltransferases subunit 3-domain-containing protein [Pilaira anomala]|nr:histone acetyltransferases subunit 3-domain-containing protein [Pilaira anomala]